MEIYVFEVYKSGMLRRRKWFWRLKANNGEIVAQGQGYTTKVAVFKTLHRIKDMALTAEIVDLTATEKEVR